MITNLHVIYSILIVGAISGVIYVTLVFKNKKDKSGRYKYE